MSDLHYRDAQKLALRETRACAANGEYPYLPALDDFVPPERSAAGQSLGLVTIPAEFIVGTKTRGRTNAFARNFLPLLADNTEFAQKWERLCQSHLEEGIREPILAYEYLNRYYVQEGNKRVSVLKFFDAVSVAAQVVRVSPLDEDSAETRQYREYLAFNRVSGVNFLELTQRGGYARLLGLLGKEQQEPWTDEERRRFTAAFAAFRSACAAAGGNRLRAAVGDAFLACLEIYGYEKLRESGTDALKQAVVRMWEEVRLQQEDAPIEIKSEPADEKKPGLLARVLPAARPVKVAFVYDRSPETSAWALGHEQGRLHAQEVFAGRLETAAYPNVLREDARALLERIVAEDGCRVVFTTSPRLLPASLQAAVAHPEATILNCSLNQSHRYIRTYYARIHEAKFVVGAIAGALAGGEDVGYIADYPIYGQIAGINAFALGVQLVNPRARVALEWSSVDGHRAARRKLIERGVRLISCQDLTRGPDGRFGPNGLTRADGDASETLAVPLWRWDVYYEALLRRVLDNTLRDEYAESPRALNYYWGMAAGVGDVQWSPQLPEGVRKLAAWLSSAIRGGACDPFALPVRGQDGTPVAADGGALGLEQIVNMDYLVQNVDGAIPAYSDLNRGRDTVEVMGVDAAARPACGGETNAP